MNRSGIRIALLGVAASILACSDATSPPDAEVPGEIALAGLIASNATHNEAAGAGTMSGVAVTYVSLAPGTLAGIESARIRNVSAGGTEAELVQVVDGGFDPAPIPAGEGDELEIAFTHTDGNVSLYYLIVPPHRPPTIVRTSPPKGRTDVVLSVQPAIIFSEPIDSSTSNSASVQLLLAGVPVAGTVERLSDQPWRVDFVPAAPLQSATTYELVITRDVRDEDGDALEAAASVTFTTTIAEGLPPGEPDPAIAFASDRAGTPYIYVANADGSRVTRLVKGEKPAWSRDGQRLAFHRRGGADPDSIYVMDAHGFDLVFLTSGTNPAWSPDGKKIVFHRGPPDGGLFVINADGSGGEREIINDAHFGCCGTIGQAAWSPDGNGIAFVGGTDWWLVPNWTYIADAEVSQYRLLNNDGWRTVNPAWSPDGSRIAVTATGFDFQTRHVVWAIASYDVVAESREDHYRASLDYLGRPDWSPDGRSVVFDGFASSEPGRSSVGSRMRIYIVSLETGELRQLIPDAVNLRGDYWDYDVAWSRAKTTGSVSR